MLVTRRRRIVEEEVTQVITNTNSDDNWKKWMEYEENRLDSFKLWHTTQPHLDVNLVQRLARAGFYRSHGLYTECFSCGLRKDVAFWLGDKDLEKVHSELRPNCDFVKQLGKMREQMKYSLSSWWLKDYQLDASVTARLARAGFFYSRNGTECFSCRMWKPLSFWQNGHDPMMVHRKLRPDCKFLTGQSEQQSPSGIHKPHRPKQEKNRRKANEKCKNANGSKKNQGTYSNTLEENHKVSTTRDEELIKLENNASKTTSQPVVDTWQTAVDAKQTDALQLVVDTSLITGDAAQPIVDTSQPVVADTSQPVGDTLQPMVYQQLSVTHETWTGNDVSWTVSDASRTVDSSGSRASVVERGNVTGSPGTQEERATQKEIVSFIESPEVSLYIEDEILFVQFFIYCVLSWKQSITSFV